MKGLTAIGIPASCWRKRQAGIPPNNLLSGRNAMEKNTTQKIGNLIVFLFFGTVAITGCYYIVLKLTGQAASFEHFLESAATGQFFNETRPSDPARQQYVFHRGVAQSVARARFIYRGIEGKTIRVDVIIPALDPESVYHYRLDIDQAYAGFRIGGARFKLIKASRTALRLKRESA